MIRKSRAIRDQVTAGLPHLDVFTISEEWALTTSLHMHWDLLADSIGLRPAKWNDSSGDPMYGAVIALATSFTLSRPVQLDDVVTIDTEIASIRKPHAVSTTTFSVDGTTRARVTALSSFVKRAERGSNKKFSKVRDVWKEADFDPETVEGMLDTHHTMKGRPVATTDVFSYEVNKIQDFNAAHLLYFKNFVRIAKCFEWSQNRHKAPRLNRDRVCWYYGNVEDGDILKVAIGRTGDACVAEILGSTGQRIFLSLAMSPTVSIDRK